MAKPEDVQRKLLTDELFFPHNILGVKPWSIQRRIIKYVMNLEGLYHNRTAVRSCHGIGKSFISANIALQFLYTFKPSIVISTAPTFRQVEKVIWKEIRRSFYNTKYDLGGYLQDGAPNLQIIKDQWYAMGFTTSDGDKFQGLHAENILVIVDEAAGVTESMFESIEGLMTSSNSRLLLIGNPTSVTGTFKKAFSEPGWNRINVSAFDTPNFKYHGLVEEDFINGNWQEKFEIKNKRIPMPNLVTPMWVHDKLVRYGEKSTYWKTRVKGDFDEEGTDSLIPLSWVEAAYNRNDDLPEEGIKAMGLDVAEMGRDTSNLYLRHGRKSIYGKQYAKMKLMELSGLVLSEYIITQADVVNVDSIGIGSGVEGRLEEMGVKTHRINSSESPGGLDTIDPEDSNKRKFYNKRAQLYWYFREQLDIENAFAIGLLEDDELTEEIMATKYKFTSSGKIQIIPKADIKKAIGRSPDKLDSVVMAFASDEVFIKGKEKLNAGVW